MKVLPQRGQLIFLLIPLISLSLSDPLAAIRPDPELRSSTAEKRKQLGMVIDQWKDCLALWGEPKETSSGRDRY